MTALHSIGAVSAWVALPTVAAGTTAYVTRRSKLSGAARGNKDAAGLALGVGGIAGALAGVSAFGLQSLAFPRPAAWTHLVQAKVAGGALLTMPAIASLVAWRTTSGDLLASPIAAELDSANSVDGPAPAGSTGFDERTARFARALDAEGIQRTLIPGLIRHAYASGRTDGDALRIMRAIRHETRSAWPPLAASALYSGHSVTAIEIAAKEAGLKGQERHIDFAAFLGSKSNGRAPRPVDMPTIRRASDAAFGGGS
jgi:hypothetical protein